MAQRIDHRWPKRIPGLVRIQAQPLAPIKPARTAQRSTGPMLRCADLAIDHVTTALRPMPASRANPPPCRLCKAESIDPISRTAPPSNSCTARPGGLAGHHPMLPCTRPANNQAPKRGALQLPRAAKRGLIRFPHQAVISKGLCQPHGLRPPDQETLTAPAEGNQCSRHIRLRLIRVHADQNELGRTSSTTCASGRGFVGGFAALRCDARYSVLSNTEHETGRLDEPTIRP